MRSKDKLVGVIWMFLLVMSPWAAVTAPFCVCADSGNCCSGVPLRPLHRSANVNSLDSRDTSIEPEHPVFDCPLCPAILSQEYLVAASLSDLGRATGLSGKRTASDGKSAGAYLVRDACQIQVRLSTSRSGEAGTVVPILKVVLRV